MYNIKIISNRNDGVTHMVPAYRYSYQKIMVGSKKELEDERSAYTDYWQPYTIPDDFGDGFGVPMWIIGVIDEDGGYQRIILCGGFAYVMNENGKTIDKLD